MARIQCVVVTPEATVCDAEVDFVVIPLYDGEVGIAPGHTPMIGRLGYGEMRLRDGQHTDRYYIDGGFAEVRDDMVTLLTNRAVPASELDSTAIQQNLSAAIGKVAKTTEEMSVRDRLIAQGRGQLRVAQRAGTD